MNKTSIIIISYNNLKMLEDCISSIYKYTTKENYEIIIVDNNSNKETKDWIKSQNNIKYVINNENKGFVKACNQGITISNKNNDILLLNNDTIVTKDWLSHLKKALYSSKNIGMVGPVCNNNENLQGTNITFFNFNEMQKRTVENYNINKNKWEEKVFLIGFCILIKREVINKIGLLDENYSPGYVDDNDLSLNIIKAGYKLLLCHDVFIYHYLGSEFRKDLTRFYKILNKNRKYFEKKWGFNTFKFDDYKNLTLFNYQENLDILDIDCGIGTNILKMKYLYPKINIYGLEENKNMYDISKNFSTVYNSNIYNINKYISNKKFDYILIDDINNNNDYKLFLKNLLKENGIIVDKYGNKVQKK